MKPIYVYEEPRDITLAELCQALSDGNLPSRQEEDFYTISKRDLLRFARSCSRDLVALDTASMSNLLNVVAS